MAANDQPVPDLLAAFDLRPPELVALVGGGGKTSLMLALARAAVAQGWRAIATTTTRIFAAQMKQAPVWLTPEARRGAEKEFWGEVEHSLERHGWCVVVGEIAGEKALGVAPELPGALLRRTSADLVVVEADGSRMRPIKAPADHEPVMPPETTLLAPVVGIDALAQPIATVAHRPELVVECLRSNQYSVSGEQRLTPEMVATLIIDPRGGLKGVPDQARVIPFVNKVETAAQLSAARRIAHHILKNASQITDHGSRITDHGSRLSRVVVGAVQSERPVCDIHRPVTAVILAAGAGNRMGARTKQLLPWGETTVLGQTIRNATASLAHDVVVVSGYEAAKIETVTKQEGVRVVHNSNYARGEMLSSLQTAVSQLPSHVAAVLVMLADQPLVDSDVIDELLAAFWRGGGELIAPVHQGRRGNPVLIGRRYFAELLTLPVGDAPRTLLRRHREQLRLVPVGTDAIFQDLDRPEDYERLRP